MNGIVCENKPRGFTSFDVIAKLRGIMKIRRLGHGGTLDPMATGVLPVFVGTATKACDIMPDNTKSYRAGFKLGQVTDTQDITGEVLTSSDMAVSRDTLEAVIPEFVGDIMQLPPMYSAVQVNGQRLYDLARQGVEVERTPRQIHVDRLELVEYDEESREGVLEIYCGKGTYIRTIINQQYIRTNKTSSTAAKTVAQSLLHHHRHPRFESHAHPALRHLDPLDKPQNHLIVPAIKPSGSRRVYELL